MTAGALPSRRYNRAWLTQRLLNRAPEWTRARNSPVSIAQQLLNVMALEIQETEQAIAHERNNANLATCDASLPDHAWKVELPPRFEFSFVEEKDRSIRNTPPSVWGEINGTNTEITLAEKNDIQTLFYEALPTRIEYGEVQTLWGYVVPETKASELSSISPEALPIEGPLYITLKGNNIWEEEFKGILYRTQIHLQGTDLLDEPIEEVIALRANETYKTRCNWKTLTEFYVLHISSDATISISSFPFDEEEISIGRNVAIDSNGIEQYQFYQLGSHAWGSTVVGKKYLALNMDQVRMGLCQKTTNMEMELLDEIGANVTANAIVFVPWTNYAYVVDDSYLYVYDYSLPFPDVQYLSNDTGDSRMSIVLDNNKWIYTRDESVEIHTRILDLSAIPVSNRWSITYPDGSKYRLGLDGSLWPISIDGWIINQNYADEIWAEQKIVFSNFTQTGTYTIEFEGRYLDEEGTTIYRSTKEIIFVPAIMPETQLLLPVELRSSRNIGFDNEGKLWFYNGTSILKSDILYDYFIVDYEKKTIWLREQYPLLRVVP